MQQLLDFFARVGDVALGIVVTVIVILLVIGAIIEIIDFLIVDPISRAKQSEPADNPFPSEEE